MVARSAASAATESPEAEVHAIVQTTSVAFVASVAPVGASAPGDGLGGVVEQLADGHHVATSDSAETLALRLVERH